LQRDVFLLEEKTGSLLVLKYCCSLGRALIKTRIKNIADGTLFRKVDVINFELDISHGYFCQQNYNLDFWRLRLFAGKGG